MLKEVKENKKLEIIKKINTFIAFCAINGDFSEKEKIEDIKRYLCNHDTSELDIYIMKIKDCCSITIYFVDKATQKEWAKFRLPNIF